MERNFQTLIDNIYYLRVRLPVAFSTVLCLTRLPLTRSGMAKVFLSRLRFVLATLP